MTYTVSITSQGQMTIPADIRLALGLQKASKAIARVDGGKMVVEPVPDVLDLYGAFKTKKRLSWKKTRAMLDEAWARGEI
ncbi:MAG: AbrB/MazE/SpoVT family DNA-binding domain-containing protein [Candidatus Gottesmanbacteria bacterium]|nr:AbrB/MazE/SpoVT family DNA-binding domain-containing protein [Candidatus Gottesmanbacteria bacterium]